MNSDQFVGDFRYITHANETDVHSEKILKRK